MMKAWFLAAVLIATSTAVAAAEGTTCPATLSAYKQIQTGNSYREVVAVIGCEGILVSSSQFGDSVSESYRWSGSGDLFSSLSASFQNDRLITKSQMHLK